MSIKQGEYLKKLRRKRDWARTHSVKFWVYHASLFQNGSRAIPLPILIISASLPEFLRCFDWFACKRWGTGRSRKCHCREWRRKSGKRAYWWIYRQGWKWRKRGAAGNAAFSSAAVTQRERVIRGAKGRSVFSRKGKRARGKKKGKEKKKLAVSVVSRAGSYRILLNRYIFGCKRLENGLDSAFDNSSFFIQV